MVNAWPPAKCGYADADIKGVKCG